MAIAIEELLQYIGRSENSVEVVSYRDLQFLAGILGYPLPWRGGRRSIPWPQSRVPPFAHWLNANPIVARDEMGNDGHPARGGFIPDIPLPRRMWAGSKVNVIAPYCVGQELRHRRTIRSIVPKHGRSGQLVFLTLLHEYHVGADLVISEQQDLVYRESAAVQVSPPGLLPVEELKTGFDYDWFEVVSPDPVWLFQYSAASLNSHRIHFEREYATRVEKYPGLVIHGPLIASLLLDLYQRENPAKTIANFECTALSPLFDVADFYILGRETETGAELSAVDSGGARAMGVVVKSSPQR